MLLKKIHENVLIIWIHVEIECLSQLNHTQMIIITIIMRFVFHSRNKYKTCIGFDSIQFDVTSKYLFMFRCSDKTFAPLQNCDLAWQMGCALLTLYGSLIFIFIFLLFHDAVASLIWFFVDFLIRICEGRSI